MAEIYSSLLLGYKASWTALHQLLQSLPRWEQKAFFDGMMRDVARKYLIESVSILSLTSSPAAQDRSIEAVAALVCGITENSTFLQDYIVGWLVDDNGSNASIGLPARRAVMATLSNHEGKLFLAHSIYVYLTPARKASEGVGPVYGNTERKVANPACFDLATRR